MLALAGLTACKKAPSGSGKNYSLAEGVSVTLKKSNREDGLRQVESRQEAKTFVTTVGRMECRGLRSLTNIGHIYFLIDPTFKATNLSDVKVVVEYFDATSGAFSLEYDGQAGTYTKIPRMVQQKRTLQWEIAEFILKNPRFQNLQDNNADFRLEIHTPFFYVRKVSLRRAAGNEPAQPIVGDK